MTWQQITLTTTESIAPNLSDAFSELGAVSVTYMDAADEPVYEPNIGETKIWTHTKVIALFEMDIDIKSVKLALTRQFGQQTLSQWQSQILEDQVWERAWMEHYHPMKFGNKLWVCPTHQEQQEAGTVCLTLDPGLAFGTGTHPTTALCLEWLASHDLKDKVLIDFGCGSGILAVAALLLGAKQVHAIDIDPQALIATKDNAEKNGVLANIQCYLPEDFQTINADIVIANILANPLIELAEQLIDLIKPQGQLILSGILNEQAQAVSLAYSTQLHVSSPIKQDDWCRLDAVKPMSD